jgi:molybdopterin adenylyltransferase
VGSRLRIERRGANGGAKIQRMHSANTAVCRCGIITVSATRRAGSDTSGLLVRNTLTAAGHNVIRQSWISSDMSDIRYLLHEWVGSSELDVIVVIGGTGMDPADVTPEALEPLVSKPIPGFGEIFRRLAFDELGVHALESRAMAALCYRTLVYVLPGAPQAVDLALHRLIVPQLSTVGSIDGSAAKRASELRFAPEPVQVSQAVASGRH